MSYIPIVSSPDTTLCPLLYIKLGIELIHIAAPASTPWRREYHIQEAKESGRPESGYAWARVPQSGSEQIYSDSCLPIIKLTLKYIIIIVLLYIITGHVEVVQLHCSTTRM